MTEEARQHMVDTDDEHLLIECDALIEEARVVAQLDRLRAFVPVRR